MLNKKNALLALCCGVVLLMVPACHRDDEVTTTTTYKTKKRGAGRDRVVVGEEVRTVKAKPGKPGKAVVRKKTVSTEQVLSEHASVRGTSSPAETVVVE